MNSKNSGGVSIVSKNDANVAGAADPPAHVGPPGYHGRPCPFECLCIADHFRQTAAPGADPRRRCMRGNRGAHVVGKVAEGAEDEARRSDNGDRRSDPCHLLHWFNNTHQCDYSINICSVVLLLQIWRQQPTMILPRNNPGQTVTNTRIFCKIMLEYSSCGNLKLR
jgi:hypothetical protein